MTTIDTLIKHDTMFKGMFSGLIDVETDGDGYVVIDRSGKYFGTILNFLRDGSVPLPEDKNEIREMLAEARYYCIQDLVEQLEQALDPASTPGIICYIPLVTNASESELILQSTKKPVIKLLCNRHNNKYSYTPNSDDNFLRNIELFDRLALNFHHRIQFVKDPACANEICCWLFYGDGSKRAEICCSFIVYGQDKKNTKIDFPEASIYKEVLHILLYEPGGHRKPMDTETLNRFWRLSGGTGSAPAPNSGSAGGIGGGTASDDDLDSQDLVQQVARVDARLRSQRRT